MISSVSDSIGLYHQSIYELERRDVKTVPKSEYKKNIRKRKMIVVVVVVVVAAHVHLVHA